MRFLSDHRFPISTPCGSAPQLLRTPTALQMTPHSGRYPTTNDPAMTNEDRPFRVADGRGSCRESRRLARGDTPSLVGTIRPVDANLIAVVQNPAACVGRTSGAARTCLKRQLIHATGFNPGVMRRARIGPGPAWGFQGLAPGFLELLRGLAGAVQSKLARVWAILRRNESHARSSPTMGATAACPRIMYHPL